METEPKQNEQATPAEPAAGVIVTQNQPEANPVQEAPSLTLPEATATPPTTDIVATRPIGTGPTNPDAPVMPLQSAPIQDQGFFARAKKLFVYIAVGSVILSAIITIVSILVGQFSDITWRALGTTASICLHALLALAFVTVNHKHSKPGDRLIENVVFVIVVASFLDTIMGIWGIISGDIAWRLYMAFFWGFIGAVIIRSLLPTLAYTANLRRLCTFTIAMTIVLYLLLLPAILLVSDTVEFPDFYYRLLAAAGVLEGTLCVLVAIFSRLHTAKVNPPTPPQPK